MTALALPMPGWAESLRLAGHIGWSEVLQEIASAHEGGFFAFWRPIVTQLLVLGVVFNTLFAIAAGSRRTRPGILPEPRSHTGIGFWAWQASIVWLVFAGAEAPTTVAAESLPTVTAWSVMILLIGRLFWSWPDRSPSTWFAAASIGGLAATILIDLLGRVIEPPLAVRLMTASSWTGFGLILPAFAIAYRLAGTWRSHRLAIVQLWLMLLGAVAVGLANLHHTGGPALLAALGTTGGFLVLAGTLAGVYNLLATKPLGDLVTPQGRWLTLGIVGLLVVAADGLLLSLVHFQAVGQFTAWQTTAHDLRLLVVLSLVIATFRATEAARPGLERRPILGFAAFWLVIAAVAFVGIPGHLAGIGRGLMWQTLTPNGGLRFPNVVDTTRATVPLYGLTALGWGFALLGFLLAVRTAFRTGFRPTLPRLLGPPSPTKPHRYDGEETMLPMAGRLDAAASLAWHRRLEIRPILLALAPFAVLAIFLAATTAGHAATASMPVRELSPLESIGRQIYRDYNCNQCHTQVIRPILGETRRYGDPTPPPARHDADLVGIRRVGPDLARIGGKFDATWHLRHFESPQQVMPHSLMPAMPRLLDNQVDLPNDARPQAEALAAELEARGAPAYLADREVVALIAYLQTLGRQETP